MLLIRFVIGAFTLWCLIQSSVPKECTNQPALRSSRLDKLPRNALDHALLAGKIRLFMAFRAGSGAKVLVRRKARSPCAWLSGERAGGIFGELDSVRARRGLFGDVHTLTESSRCRLGHAHNGNGAVAQAVHLVQAARLEFRGHQIKKSLARPRCDATVPLVKTNSHGDFCRDTAPPGLDMLFSNGIGANRRRAARERHIGAEHFFQRRQLDVQALLLRQPRDAAK